MRTFTIALADDHVMFRKGIKRIIDEIPGLEVIGEANDGLEMLELLKKSSPEMIIMDISMPNLRGLEATREIKQIYPHINILLLTMHKKKEYVQQALAAGAEGFLLKEDADYELLQAIQTIREGKKFISPLLASEVVDLVLVKSLADPLSPREREVVKLLAEGKSAQEIAAVLYISVFTVRRHRENIMRKLNLKKVVDLVRYAISEGYISAE